MALSFEEIKNKVTGQQRSGTESFDEIKARVSQMNMTSPLTADDVDAWFAKSRELEGKTNQYLSDSGTYDGWKGASSPYDELHKHRLQEASVRAWLNSNKDALGDRYDALSAQLGDYSGGLGRLSSAIRDTSSNWRNSQIEENRDQHISDNVAEVLTLPPISGEEAMFVYPRFSYPGLTEDENHDFVEALKSEMKEGLGEKAALDAVVDHVYKVMGLDPQASGSREALPLHARYALVSMIQDSGLQDTAVRYGIGNPVQSEAVNDTEDVTYENLRPWDTVKTTGTGHKPAEFMSDEYLKINRLAKEDKAQEIADAMYSGGGLGKAFAAGAASGINRVATGLEQFKNVAQGRTEPVARNFNDFAGDVIARDGTALQKGVFDITSNVVAMAPAVAAGGPLGLALTGVTSGANSYRDAKIDGYATDAALLYGAINGAVESSLQYALGGIKGLGKGGASKLIQKIPGIKDTASKVAAKVVTSDAALRHLRNAGGRLLSMTDEGLEEYLQAVIDPVIRNAVLGEDNAFEPFSSDKLYAGLMGVLTSGLFNLFSGNGVTRAQNTEDPGGSASTQSGISFTQSDFSPEAKNGRAGIVRETGTANRIDPAAIQLVASVAEKTGRNIQFVETLGGRNGKYDAKTNTLYIAADAANPVKTVLKHELTHSLEGTEAYKELSDYIADIVVRETGISLDNIIEAKIGTYALEGEALDSAGAMAEIIADYVGDNLFASEAAIRRLSAEKPGLARRILDWIREMKTRLFGTERDNMLAQAERLYRNALAEPVASRSGVQYSVQHKSDGSKYVLIDTDQDIFDGVPRREWPKVARQYINSHFRGKALPLGDYDAARVKTKASGEYAHPRNQHPTQSSEFEAKMKASTELDNLMEAAEYAYSAKDTKSHPEASLGWDYYTVRFALDGQEFEGLINIANGENSRQFYDMTKIREVPDTRAEPDASLARSAPSFRNLSSDTIVPQSTDGVNTSISENGPYDPKSSIGSSSGNTAADIKAMVERYGAIKRGEAPARDVKIPKRTSDNTKVRQFVRTAAESSQVPDSFLDGITDDVMNDVYSYVPASNEAAMKQAVNTVESVGLNGAIEQWNAVVNGHHVPGKNDVALGEYLLTLAGKNDDPALASKMITELSVVATNAGQTVQAMSMLKRMTPEGRLMALQKVADQINRQNPKSNIKIPESIIDRVQKVNPRDTEAVDGIMRDGLVSIAEQVPSTWLDKWNAWRYLAMLGNPRTHVRNVAGNAAFTPVIYVKNILAGAIEEAVDAVSKAVGGKGITRTKTAFSGLPFLKRRKYLDFVRQDYQKMKEVLSAGGARNPADVIRDNQTVFTSALMKPIEAARKGNFKAMEAEDAVFKRLHYERALMQYLSANKIDLSKLDADTLNRGRNYAVREAQKATFTDASALASALNRLSRKHKSAQFIVEGLLPFKKTPINILKRGVEYSPAGLFDAVTRKAYQLKKGDITTADFIDSLSAGLTGTSIMALGMWLASMGVLTGGLGDDEEDRFSTLQGQQEYAINIGDTSFTIDWASPSALPLLVGAEIFKLGQESKDGDIPLSKALEALTNLSEPMVNMSMLQGINDAIENVKFSENPLVDFALNAGAGYLSQGVPTLLGQIARTSDDRRRRNYVEQGEAFPSLQYAAQRSKSKIPGALQTQQPYVDAWGREEPTGNIGERAFSNFLSPGYVGEQQTSDMEEELKRLYKETGDSGVLPSAASKSVTYDGERYSLSAEEYTEYQRTMGKTAYTLLTDLTDSAPYQSMSDEQKVDAVSTAYAYAGDLAKEIVLAERGIEYAPSSKRKNMDAAQRNGVPVSVYLQYSILSKDLKADKKGNGDAINGSLRRKKEALLTDMKVNSQQRRVLLALDGYGSKQLREQILNGGTASSNETAIDRLLKEAFQ